MPEPFTKTFHDTAWGKMLVRSAGNGETIVLVHGLGVSGKYFERSGELLAQELSVYIPDLPGSGSSSKPGHVLNVGECADVLAEWSRAMGLSRIHWVGNSFGCQVLVELSVRYPNLVKSLVLLGPTIEAQARTTWQQLFRLLLDATREPYSELFIVAWDYFRFGPRRFWRTFVYAREDKIEEKLWQVKAPVLILHGERDPIVPLHWAEFVQGLLPDARLVNVTGAAHTVHYSHPAQFRNEVMDFTRGLRD